ncbi:MAG: acyloxyacyl hydrolase [Rhodospirillaceae bacterium]|nr:acyloxyacyl hydrolase [Rhodospirillaceae bacterium]
MARFLAVVAVLAGFAFPRTGHAADPAAVILNAGVFDLVGHRTQYVEGRIEYRFGHGLFDNAGEGGFRGLKPLVGFMVNSKGATYAYAGLAAPIQFGAANAWEFTPAAGMGVYSKAKGLDPGQPFEFHLALGLSYRVLPNARLGVAIDHISNAGTGRVNPGINSALVTWAFAFPGL